MPKIIEEAKKAILLAAKKELADQGVAYFTMRSVAQRANMAVGTLYHYFPDKTSLLATILFEDWESRFKAVSAELKVVESLEDGINKIVFLIRSFHNDSQYIFEQYRTNEFSQHYIKNHPKFIRQLDNLWLILKKRFLLSTTSEEDDLISEMMLTVSKSQTISLKTLNSVIHKITTKEN